VKDSKSWRVTKVYGAIPCQDYFTQVYGSEANFTDSLLIEIGKLGWLCPNMGAAGNYTLANDPMLKDYGANFIFVVNLCQSALTNKSRKALCVTDQT